MELKREIDPLLIAAFSYPGMFYPIAICRIEWPGGDVLVHSGVGDLEWNGDTYRGIGQLGGISTPEEAPGIVPSELGLSIAGELSALLQAQDELERNSLVQIWLGATTMPGEPSSGLIGEPMQIGSAFIDSDGELTPESTELLLNAVSGSPARSSAQITHSSEDQKSKYPNDTFFDRASFADAWKQNFPRV